MDRETRRETLDELAALNQQRFDALGDPEIQTRIAQYEMAFRMQASVPELTDISKEPQHVLDMYGPDVKTPGTYAANCLLARRLAERDVRFVQLFHMGWDHHGGLPNAIRGQCRDTDQPTAALHHRPQAARAARRHAHRLGRRIRPHHLLAGHAHRDELRARPPPALLHHAAGRRGREGRASRYGETDDYCYNIVRDPVHVHDLNATILHLLGVEPRAAHLPLPGPRFPAHGHPRRGAQAAAGVEA